MSFVPSTALARTAPPASSASPPSIDKLRRILLKKAGRAIADHEMIAAGDKVMVCVSGGKDSYAMLDVLELLRRRAPVEFELIAVNIDQGWPGYETGRIEAHLREVGVPYRMITEDYARIVEAKLEPGQTPCSLCSRFRRGVLYNLAGELGANKIALGHHADDLIETLVLNLFYSGKLASMPATLRSDDGRNVVIRPLAYADEATVASYAELRGFPVVRCGCPSCGLPEQKRQVVKRWLAELEAAEPGIKSNMLGALKNVRPSHLLDPRLKG